MFGLWLLLQACLLLPLRHFLQLILPPLLIHCQDVLVTCESHVPYTPVLFWTGTTQAWHKPFFSELHGTMFAPFARSSLQKPNSVPLGSRRRASAF